MSLKTNLMTSAAALALVTGSAFAQDNATVPTETENPEYAVGWNEELDQQYGDIADTQVAELIGMNVISENGDDVGEVDNFVLLDDELKAVIGVGGFLGLGEHEVAISLSDMTYNGEALVISFTKEELEAMPEYTDELEARRLAADDTFRQRQMTEEGQPVETETASVEGATGSDEPTAGNTEGQTLAEGSGETEIKTDETAGQATADASVEAEGEGEPMETASADGEGNGDMEATGDGSTEMAATQSVDAEAEVDIDEEQTAAADSMENADEQVEEQQAAEADTEAATEEETEMTAEVDPGTSEEASPSGEEVAAAEEAAEAAGQDGDTMTEEVAENEQGEIEQEAEELMAEAEAATEEAGEEIAQATTETEEAVEGAGENVAAATEEATDEAAEESREFAQGWNEGLDEQYAPIADVQVAELIGMNVVTEGGEDVGEVDNFILHEDALKVVVGVGGFLGLGEHEVALPLEELTYEGDQLVIAYTKEELEAMPEYTEEMEATALNETDTFRSRGEAEVETEVAATEEPVEAEGEAEVMAEVDPGTSEEASPSGEEVAAAEEATGDDPVEEQVAENEQGEIEQEAEELTAEAEAATEEAGEEMAEAAEATENAVEGAATETAAAVEGAAEETGDWFSKFTEIADWELNEIEGKDVASADGNVIGEIDDLGRQNGKLVALVGIGGFLGLGEHDVALEMSNLSWDGEKFITDGYTEEDLKAMSEYDAETIEILDDDTTLKSHADM